MACTVAAHPGPAVAQASTAPRPPDLTAPVAFLVDVGSDRVLLAREPHRSFPPASLTKIMTAFVGFELIARGKLRPEQLFIVSEETSRAWSGVGTSMALAGGSRVSVDDLLRGIMTASANDAAVVLAQGSAGSVEGFAALMNAQAKALGLRDSRFANPSGWPDGGATVTSAADLATLTRAMLTRHPALYRRYVGQPAMRWNGRRLASRNPLLGTFNGADGVKTGYTREAGYGLVGSAQRGDRRLVAVVAGLGSEAARAAEGRALLEWGFSAWRTRPLFARGQVVAQARVQGGESRTVPLVAPQSYHLTVAPGEPRHHRLKVRYRGPLRAPVRADAPVAELIVTAPGQPDRRLPLEAGQAVAPAGAAARLRNGLYGIVGW